ncbi:heterokaryon incompatibility protein-domain-containing protein [Lanmaoa asiatica]|nr:heterokaryon incompatibility protein-domain-containing protein [Lanmaoa asiatica]
MLSTHRDPDSDPSPSTSIILDPIFIYPTLDDRGASLLRATLAGYEAGVTTEPDARMMDDTFKVLLRKSHSTVAATHLAVPLPLLPLPPTTESELGNQCHSPSPSPDTVSFEQCRRCAGEYIFLFSSDNSSQTKDESITIIAGVPRHTSPPYKAMSYVWGPSPQAPLRIPCNQCGHVTCAPISSVQRFHNLMALGGAGNTIWLDALSIDQSDEHDVASNVAVMGTIYKQARCVSVLLPAADNEAYQCLKHIEWCAKDILAHCGHFVYNDEITIEDSSTGREVKFLSTVCDAFIKHLLHFGMQLDQYVYWSRAWTFQEWALANDLEIAVEGGSAAETCFNLKSLVLGASLLISRYKALLSDYAEIKLGRGMTRGMIIRLINAVKAIFPDEDLFLSYDEVDAEQRSFQINFPHFGLDQMLGVRDLPSPVHDEDSSETAPPTLRPRQDAPSRLRTRLILLSSFAARKREATYEADLIASWASMCNIPYAYDRHDNFALALSKVTKALRTQGLCIYNFLPDTVGGPFGPLDVFRAYAKEHPQLNVKNQAELPGAPIFTGRADTITHLTNSLRKISLPTRWNHPADDAATRGMKKVKQAQITATIALDDDLDAVLHNFTAMAIHGGQTWGFTFSAVQNVAKPWLSEVPVAQRAMARLVIVAIPFYRLCAPLPPPLYDLYTWAVLPFDIAPQDVVVCREPINGTLALATKREGTYRIIAYLTLTDHFTGTFLLQTDEIGKIDLTLRIPEIMGMSNSGERQLAVRQLYGYVGFDRGADNETNASMHRIY